MSYRRDVEEQLAEALLMLGQATLKHALAGLNQLLTTCRKPVHQELLLWLWVLGYDRFGQVTLGSEGSGLRLWFSDGGPDLMLAVDSVEVAVHVDSMTEPERGLSLRGEQIDAHPRMMAERVLDHLEKRRAEADRKAEKQANTVPKRARSATPARKGAKQGD